MKKLLSNNIFKNISASSLRTAIFTIQQILYVSLFIKFLKIDLYAEWILVSSIPILLMQAEIGISSYTSNLVTIAYNQNRKFEINKILINSIFFITLIIFFVILIFLISNFFFNFRNIFSLTKISVFEFKFIIILLTLRLLCYNIWNLFLSILKAIHKNHYLSNFQTASLITEILLVIIILFFKSSLIYLAMSMLINQIIFLLISYFYIKKFYNLNLFSFEKISKKFFYKILYPSISFMSLNLSKVSIIQGTILFLSIYSSSTILVFYNSLRVFFNGIRQIISILSMSYYPEFTIYYSKKKNDQIKKKFVFLLKLNTLISFIAVIVSFYLTEIIFSIWIKNEFIWNSIFFILFLLASLIDWINVPILSLPYSINKHVSLNLLYICTVFLYFILLIILNNFFEFASVPLSLFFSNVILLIFSYKYVKEIIHR